MHAHVERELPIGCAIDKIVDIALHRADVVLKAHTVPREAREHKAAVFADARRSREPEVGLVESLAAAFRHRHGEELAVGVVGPAVVATDQPVGVALAFVDHLWPAMGAAVKQHLHAAILVPAHDHRLAAEVGGDVVARVRHLARMADEQPGTAENTLKLKLEHVGIGIDTPVHPAWLDQLGDFIGVSVAHGYLSIGPSYPFVMAGLDPAIHVLAHAS